jgi:hypothetical protein
MHGRKRWPAMGSAAVTMRYVFFLPIVRQCNPDDVVACWFSAAAPIWLAQQESHLSTTLPHDMHTKTRWPPISLTPHFFFAIVTLFVILSEFQRYHNAIFHWYITHGLADPNCILKRRPAYSTCLAIHRFVCYITK